MDPVTLAGVGKALMELGPWGLLVVCGAVIRHLSLRRDEDALLADKEKQVLNDRLVSMAEKHGELTREMMKNQALFLSAVTQRRAKNEPAKIA